VTHPELAAELVDTDPATVSAGSVRSLLWSCPNHPEPFPATPASRARGTTCGYCSNVRVLLGFNDLVTTHPDIAARLLDPDPLTITAGSGATGTWSCPAHPQTHQTRICRVAQGALCPYCSRRAVLAGFNDLLTTHPDVAATVVDSDPATLLAGSDRIVHWRCANHAQPYPMSVVGRVKGNECGFCANVRVLPGFNDLATTHPDLAAQMVGADATTITAGSMQVVDWVCPNHLEPFPMKVRERVRGHGCGYCAHKKVLVGFNDLASQYPAIAAELIGRDPATVYAGGSKKLSWRCPLGHKYPAPARARIDGGGCPYCVGFSVQPGFNDLATTRPDLVDLLVSPDPTTVSAGSDRTGEWSCPKHDATYEMRISHRATTSGCPFCSGRRILPGFNDLATTHPELAAELVDIDPATVTFGRGGVFAWSCPNHEATYPARMSSRVQGNGCPFCSHHKVLTGFNDLASQLPELAGQLVGENPSEVLAGGAGKHLWLCDQHPKHPYEVTVRARVANHPCPICSGRQLSVGVNDLASQRPDLAAELVSPNADEVTTVSTVMGSWRCANHGEPYPSTIRNRVEGRGCPYCAGKRILVGFNDLATVRPDLAAEILDLDPTTITVGTQKIATWRCDNHPEPYTTPVVERTVGRGCGYCAGKKVLQGFNDLATLRPDIAAEMLSPDPRTVLRGSLIVATWRCSTCRREWRKSVRSRTSDDSGCPDCNLGGYDVTKPGYLYLMQRIGEQQVGITSHPETRIKVHERKGWELLDVTDAMNGQRAFDIELLVRRWLRKQGWVASRTHENWSTGDLEVKTLRELFDLAGVEDTAMGVTPSTS